MYKFERKNWTTLWRPVVVRRWVSDLELETHNCPEHPGVELDYLIRQALGRRNADWAAFFCRSSRPPARRQAEAFEISVQCPGQGRPHDLLCYGKFWEDETVLPAAMLVPA